MHTVVLGKKVFTSGITLRGDLDEDDWRIFLKDVALKLRMKPVGEAACWRYPTDDGSGGVGQTLVQPITESFIIVDTWVDHKGAYLFICSCKSYDPRDLNSLFESYDLDSSIVFEEQLGFDA